MEEIQGPAPVSVILVSLDEGPALRRRLEVLQSSTPAPPEIMVVDLGSRDESATLDSEFPAIHMHRLPRNFGLTKAINVGMRTAQGEYYLFLAPRAEIQPDTIARLTEQLAAHPEAAAVCPLLVTPEGEPYSGQFRELPGPGDIYRSAMALDWSPAPAPDLGSGPQPVSFPSLDALLVRSYFLKGLRYVDERYGQAWADAEISFQIRRAGKKILLLPDVRVVLPPAPVYRETPAAQAVLDADWISGGAVYAAKHFGFISSLKIRAGAALNSLGTLRLRRLVHILNGQKIDGTQTAL